MNSLLTQLKWMEPDTVEGYFLVIFRKHMSNNSFDLIYVPQDFIRAFFADKSQTELLRLKKKYKIWTEEIFGVKHWVMNPTIEIVAPVEILSLIRQQCTEYDTLKNMEGERYSRLFDPITDDDIPF